MRQERVCVRNLGLTHFAESWRAMQRFTANRTAHSPDEIWSTEHHPVFTLGRNADRRHLLEPGRTEVICCDRGGEVTYHGPGQAVIYSLIDLRRLPLGVKGWVTLMESAVIAYLTGHHVPSEGRIDAPGVYTAGKKVASIGLRVRRGCTYHGLSLNVDLDLSPFRRIHPCGHPGLEMTRLRDLGITDTVEEASAAVIEQLCHLLPE